MKKILNSRIFIISLVFFLFSSMTMPYGQVSAADDSDFETIRVNWFNGLTGANLQYSTDDENLSNIIGNIDSEAAQYLETFNRTEDGYLWPDLDSAEISGYITQSYTRLQAMALAYNTRGSAYYHDESLKNDILYGLDWLYNNRYNENVTDRYDNWYDWEIGTPLRLKDILVLMYDSLTPELLEKYTNTISFFCPSVTQPSNTANRVWQVTILVINGALEQDSAKIRSALKTISNFAYTTAYSGFYEDGSYIDHKIAPYNGGYGLSYIDCIIDLIPAIKNTPWDFTAENKERLKAWVNDSIIPFIYDGNFMDMVRGREIARYTKPDYTAGITAINAILKFSFELPETDTDAQTYKSMVKYWLSFSSDFVAEFEKSCGLVNYVNYKKIINDDTIVPEKLGNFAKQFNQMDRTVKYGDDYAFGISMSSKNDAANFEHLNGENRKGWYTGDGMVYLYNDDRTQYAGSFWATVDPYRMPGTTVDTRERTRDGSEANYSPKNTFAGGTTLFDSYAVSGMELFAKDCTLTAKKSYFMFDDEMVALGAGINSTDSADRTIETIIENRKIKPDKSNVVSVNGTEKELSDTAEQITEVKTMHLSGNTPNSDIGYYFPNPVTVNAKKEVRSGKWKDINTYTSYDIDTVYQDSYFTSWIDHGSNPANAGYSYAVLPNKSVTELEAYSQAPDYTVLENSKDAQVVKENTLNIIGGNFWNSNTDKTVDVLTVNNPASVMLKLNDTPGGEIEISVSDPSNSNLAQGISVEINRSAKSLISVSDPEKVLVTQLSPTIKFTVLAGPMGKTFSAKFEEGEGGVIDPPDLPTPSPSPTVSPSPTPTSSPDPEPGQNHGGLLVYDGFNYKTEDYKRVSPATDTVTHKLSGKGNGWKDGWTYYTGASPIPETPQAFEIKSYGTVPFENNIKQDQNNKYMVFRNTHTRELETPINKSNSKTVWVTFLACNNSANSDAPQLNIYLVNSAGENILHYSKKGSKNANGKNPWKIRSTNGTIFSSTVDNSEMNLFITKIEYDYDGAGNDKATCWINPADTSSEAALGNPLTSFIVPDLEIASIKVYHDKATTKESYFDEFRIADNLTAALSDTQVMPSNPVYLKDPVIMSGGEVIDNLVVGNITFKATLESYKKEPVDAVVLLALYEGDELIDVITRPLSDIVSTSVEENINVTSSDQSLKVFVWQDLNTIKPYCKALEYTFAEDAD